MDKKIKKISYLNFYLAILIFVFALLQLYFEGESINYRRIRAVIGYFLIVPMLFTSFVILIYLSYYYLNHKFQKGLKYIFLNIPVLLILLYVLFVIVKIFITN